MMEMERKLLRGGTIKEVERKLETYKRTGWKDISGIKLDDSEIAFNKISYVCVVEMQDKDHNPRNKKSVWGKFR
jgi:hypothetical protein